MVDVGSLWNRLRDEILGNLQHTLQLNTGSLPSMEADSRSEEEVSQSTSWDDCLTKQAQELVRPQCKLNWQSVIIISVLVVANFEGQLSICFPV